MYLDRDGRQRFVELMLDLVTDGACHWVSNELHDILPSVTATATQQPDDWHSLVLAVDGRAVALTHQHVRACAGSMPSAHQPKGTHTSSSRPGRGDHRITHRRAHRPSL